MSLPPSQVCSACGEEKPASEFYVKSYPHGRRLSGRCKPCKRAQNRAWAVSHPDEVKEIQRAWLARNQRAKSERLRQYYLANRDEVIARTKTWREAHPGRQRELARAHARTPAAKAKSRAWARAHPEAERRRWQSYNARKRNAFVEPVDPLVVLTAGGEMCALCEVPLTLTTVQVDHIVPLAMGGEHSYANTQPACASCNARKGGRAVI